MTIEPVLLAEVFPEPDAGHFGLFPAEPSQTVTAGMALTEIFGKCGVVTSLGETFCLIALRLSVTDENEVDG